MRGHVDLGIIPSVFLLALTHRTHPLITQQDADILRHTHTHIIIHINRNTSSLAQIQHSQISLLTGCDYIRER